MSERLRYGERIIWKRGYGVAHNSSEEVEDVVRQVLPFQFRTEKGRCVRWSMNGRGYKRLEPPGEQP